jgi:hypothetical protein
MYLGNAAAKSTTGPMMAARRARLKHADTRKLKDTSDMSSSSK